MDDVKIVDIDGNVVESPDLDKGWIQDVCTTKEDGTLTVIERIYYQYSDEELAQINEQKKQDELMEQVAEFFPNSKDKMQQEIDDAAASGGVDPQLQALARMQVMTMNLTDVSSSDVVQFCNYWPEWKPNTKYKFQQPLTWKGKYYRTSKELTSQEIYPPDTAGESEYYPIEIAPDGIIVYRTCHGSYDAVQEGETRHYPDADGPVYMSLVNNNSYSPSAVPGNWKEVTSDATS